MTLQGSPDDARLTLKPTELQPRADAHVSCAHGCEDGWLEVAEGLAPCACRAERIHSRRQQALTNRKRDQCRRAGRRSGEIRRRLSPGRTWTVRQASREEFHRLYARMCEAQRLTWSLRGENTAHALYLVEMASYRAQGQAHETTNGQRARALGSRGRGRCARTVQRTRARLVAMGLIHYVHVRRGRYVPGCGWRAGQKADTLRVHLLFRVQANVTPRSGAGTGASPRSVPAGRHGIPPASPADGERRAVPALGPASPAVTEEELGRAQAEFAALRARIWGSGQGSSESSSSTSEGERWLT